MSGVRLKAAIIQWRRRTCWVGSQEMGESVTKTRSGRLKSWKGTIVYRVTTYKWIRRLCAAVLNP